MYESFSIVFAIAALLSYINYRWLKLPSTIGQMLLALVVALVIILIKPISTEAYEFFCNLIVNTDFSHILLGLVLGLVLGMFAYRLMQSAEADEYLTTVISLAIVFGGYSLAQLLHTSGPLAMVVAGLYIGRRIKTAHFRQETRETLVGFWNILDESLNGVLFVFIGLALHLVSVNAQSLSLALLSIPLLLLSRFLAVTLPYSLLKHTEHSWVKTAYVLTWGGLRGGISLALAFSLAPDLSRETLLLLTYTAVIFSILVQGLTIPRLVKRLYGKAM